MRRITARLLERSLASGARSAEAYAKIGETLGVGLDAASGLQATHTAEGGIGLRVFRDNGAEGFACACGARAGGTDEARLVEAAIAAARSPREPFPLARGKVRDERGLGIFDPRLETATQADLEELLEETTAETMRIDPRVRRLDTAFLAASTSRVRIDNTEGFTGSYKQTLFHLRMGVDARDADRSILVGQSQTARRLTAFSPTLFADRTARLAITTLEGRPPATGRFPALLAPRAAIELLRLFAGTLPPAGLAAGRRVAAPAVSIIDDGRLPGGVHRQLAEVVVAQLHGGSRGDDGHLLVGRVDRGVLGADGDVGTRDALVGSGRLP
ncbi:MAG: hypothetical protein ACE5HU_04670, partial [Acidobacteriota bacterium]